MNLNMKVEMMQFEFDSTVVREIQELNGGDQSTTNDLEELMQKLNRGSEMTLANAHGLTELQFHQTEKFVSTTRVTKKKRKKKRKKKKTGQNGEEVWEIVEYEEDFEDGVSHATNSKQETVMHKKIQKLEKEKRKWEQSAVPVQTYQALITQMERKDAEAKAKMADLELKLRVMAKRLKEAEAGGKWKQLAEKLKEENKKLNETLNMKDHELADKNETIESNQSMIEQLEKTIRELLDEKALLVDVNQKQGDQIVKLEVENSMLKERLRKAEEKADRLPEKTGDPEIDSLIDQMKELQEQLKKETDARYQEETQRKEKEKENERLQEEIEKLKQELGGRDGELLIIRETITIKEKEIIKLRKRVKDSEGFQEQLEEVKQNLKKKEDEVDRLREKLAKEKAKNEGSEDEIEDLKKKLREREKEAEDVQRTLRDRDSEIEDLRRRVRQAEDQNEDLQRKTRQQEDEIEELKRKLRNKDDEIDDLRKKLKDSQEMADRLEEQLKIVKEGSGDQDEELKQLRRERDRLEVESENLRNKVRELKDEVSDRDEEIQKLRDQIQHLQDRLRDKDQEIEKLKNELDNKNNEIIKVQETITIREKEFIKIKEKPKKRKKREEIIEYEEYSEYEDEEEEALKEGGFRGPPGRDDSQDLIQRIYSLERLLQKEKIDKTTVIKIRKGLKTQRIILADLGRKEGGELQENVQTVTDKWEDRDQDRVKQDKKEEELKEKEKEKENPPSPGSAGKQEDQIPSYQAQVDECADELEDYNRLMSQLQDNYQKEDPNKVNQNYKFIVQGLHSDYVKKPLFQEREENKEFEEMMEDIQRQIHGMEGVPEEHRNVLHQIHKKTGKQDFEKKEEKNQWEDIQNDIFEKMNNAQPVDNSDNEALRQEILKKTEDAVDSNEQAWAVGSRKDPKDDWKQTAVDPKDEAQFLKAVGDYMDRNKHTSADIEKIFRKLAELDYDGLVEIYHYMSMTDLFMTNTSKRYSQEKELKKRFKRNVSKNDELLKILDTLSDMAKFLTKKITKYEPRHIKWLTVQSEQILFTKKIETKLDQFISNDKRGTIALTQLNTSMIEKDLDAVQENNHNRLEKIYNFLDQIIHVEQMDEQEIEDLNRRLADLRMALGRKNQEIKEIIDSMEETRGLAENEPARSDWKDGDPGQTESDILNELSRGLKELDRINQDTKEAIRMRDLLGNEEKQSPPPAGDTKDWEEVEQLAREQMLEDYRRLSGEGPQAIQDVTGQNPQNINMKKKPGQDQHTEFTDSVLIDEGIINEDGTLPENTKKYLRKIKDLRDQEKLNQEENKLKAQELLAAAKKCYEEQHTTLEKGRQEIIHQEDLEDSHHRNENIAKIPKQSRKSRKSEFRDPETITKLTKEHIQVIEKYSLEIRELFKDIQNLKKDAVAGRKLKDIADDLKDKVKKGEVIVELASGQPQEPFQTDQNKPEWEKAQDYLHELHDQDDQLESILRRQRKDLGNVKGQMTGVENDLRGLHQQAEDTLNKQIHAYEFMTKRDIDDPIAKEDPDSEVHDIIVKTKKKLGRVDYYIKKMERQMRTNEDLEYEDLSIIYHSLNSMNGFISSIASKKTNNPKFQEHFDQKILRDHGTLECLEINKQFCLFVKSRFSEFKNIIIDWVKFAEENVERTTEIEAHVDSLVLSQSLQFDMSKYQSFEEGHTLGSQLRNNLTRLQKIDLFIERVGHEGIGGGKEDDVFYMKLYRQLNSFKIKYIEFLEHVCDDEFDGIRDFPNDISDVGLVEVKEYISELAGILQEQLDENGDYVVDRIENIMKAKHELKIKAQRLELKNEDLEKSVDRRTTTIAQLLIKCTVLVTRLKAIEG